MEKFSLDKWLQDKSRKVVTGERIPVRIICTDRKAKSGSIVGLVGKDEANIYVWNEQGKYLVSDSNIFDFNLYFADEEEELTEFEKKLKEVLYEYAITNTSSEEKARQYAPELLDLARKELQPEFDKEIDKAYKTQDDVVYRNGYAQGKQDALKAALESLPKWKKGTPPSSTTVYVIRKGYYMTFKEVDELFEILPKEE